MIRNHIVALVFILAILMPATACAEAISIELPTDGYFRSGQAIPFVLVLNTLGNPAKYTVSLVPSTLTEDSRPAGVVVENIIVPPRTTMRLPFRFTLDARRPGAIVRVVDELSRTRDVVFEEDLAPRLRYLNNSERFLICMGDKRIGKEIAALATIPDISLVTRVVDSNSEILAKWQFVESVDLLCLMPGTDTKFDSNAISVARQFAELGGTIVVSGASTGESAKLFCELISYEQGWNGKGSPPFLYGIKASEPDMYAIVSHGLGSVVFLAPELSAKQDWTSAWKEALENVPLYAAPVNLLPSNPDVRYNEPYVTTLFSPMDIPPSYIRMLMFTILIVFVSLLFISTLLAAFKIRSNAFVVFAAIMIAATTIAILIHNLLPRPGTVSRHRTIIEVDASGRGRITVFSSFSASSEQRLAIDEAPNSITKVLYDSNDMLPPLAPRTRFIETHWIIRGIPILPRHATVVMTVAPISTIPVGTLQFLSEGIHLSSALITSRGGTVFQRRFFALKGSNICIGMQCILLEEFLRESETPEEFEQAEWNLMHVAFLRQSKPFANSNIYWPVSEPADMANSDSITSIDFFTIEDKGAVLIFSPTGAEDDR